jgi:hypothetical protein
MLQQPTDNKKTLSHDDTNEETESALIQTSLL